MPAVQVRDLDQSVYDLLKASAKANGRSINQQLKVIVTEHFDNNVANNRSAWTPQYVAMSSSLMPVPAVDSEQATAQRAERRRSLFASIAAWDLGSACPSVDSASMVREMRDGR